MLICFAGVFNAIRNVLMMFQKRDSWGLMAVNKTLLLFISLFMPRWESIISKVWTVFELV